MKIIEEEQRSNKFHTLFRPLLDLVADHWEQTISLLLDLCYTPIGSNRGKVVSRSVTAAEERRTMVAINYINIFRGLQGRMFHMIHVRYWRRGELLCSIQKEEREVVSWIRSISYRVRGWRLFSIGIPFHFAIPDDLILSLSSVSAWLWLGSRDFLWPVPFKDLLLRYFT